MPDNLKTKMEKQLLSIIKGLGKNEIKALMNKYGVANSHVQTKKYNGEIRQHNNLKEALACAKEDPDVWKISFNTMSDERVRLVKRPVDGKDDVWVFVPIMYDGE